MGFRVSGVDIYKYMPLIYTSDLAYFVDFLDHVIDSVPLPVMVSDSNKER